MQRLFYGIFLLILSGPGFACDDLHALYETASAKLLENGPAFKHGWDDKTIQLSFSDSKTTSTGCVVTMQLILPRQDLDEVNADLNANPTKRTQLAAQEYEVPQMINRVAYHYQMVDGQVKPLADANHALTNLYRNVEYLYQSLAQLRVALKKGIRNTTPWDDKLKESEMAYCKANYTVMIGNLEFACSCRIDNLSRIMSPRQIELVHFIESQPSSMATGALKAYSHTSKEINEDCSNLILKTP